MAVPVGSGYGAVYIVLVTLWPGSYHVIYSEGIRIFPITYLQPCARILFGNYLSRFAVLKTPRD